MLSFHEGTNSYQYVADGNKNITQLISSTTGAIINKYEYNPFGALAVNNETVDNPFKFSSEYNEKETGLVYYNYRFYDPSNGKWLSRDPIEEDGGKSLYGFVHNDVINYYDKFGLVVTMNNIQSKAKELNEKRRKRQEAEKKNPCCGTKPFDAKTECCENHVKMPKFEDAAGRKCCRTEMQSVEIHSEKANYFLGNVGHSFVKTPNQTAGFYPDKSTRKKNKINGQGKVKNDKDHPYDGDLTYSYFACPKTVKAIDASINKTRRSPSKYTLRNNDGRNCSGMACKWIADGGISPPYSHDTPGLRPSTGGKGYEDNSRRPRTDTYRPGQN